MRSWLKILRLEFTMAWRNRSGIVIGISFFLTTLMVFPFALGSDPELLRKIGPGAIWIAALLATLFGMSSLLENERSSGALEVIQVSSFPAELFAFTKMLVHWTVHISPLVVLSPIVAIIFGVPVDLIGPLLVILFTGTPALTAIGMLGAAIGVAAPNANLAIPIVVLPFTIPVLIFGAGATTTTGGGQSAYAFLLAFSLIYWAFGLVGAAWILRESDT